MKPTFLSKVFQAALMCCLAVILSGCDDFLANSDNPTGTTLIMNTGDATLKVGEQLDRPAITNSPAYVLYSSSDPAVATVGHTGTVTAIAPGIATITAHVQAVGNYAAASASYKVTVEGTSSSSTSDPKSTPLTIEALEDGATVTFKALNSAPARDIQYSTDGGATWTDGNTGGTGVSVVLAKVGDRVSFRGENTTYASSAKNQYNNIDCDKNIKVYGNIMSLIQKTGFETLTALPAAYAFKELFKNNAYLIDASDLLLPAETLTNSCYDSMFFGCNSLTAAPKELPATTLANDCYSYMFQGCTKLTTAPKLPATTLVQFCYSNMFYGCTSLVEAWVKADYKDVDYECLGMFDGCATGGVLHTDGTGWAAGTNLPTGWTTIAYNAIAVTKSTPLTIEALEDGATVTFKALNSAPARDIQYSTDGGATWSDGNTGGTGVSVVLAKAGDKVSFRGENTNYATSGNNDYNHIDCDKNIKVYGNIMSLIKKTGFETVTALTATFTFKKLFMNNAYLIDASDLLLPATTLTDFCYNHMFDGCTNLTAAPKELPATTVAEDCYSSMFQGCTKLTTVPVELPAAVMKEYCYSNMFNGCTSLTTAPKLPATTLAKRCYSYMFNGCTSLNEVWVKPGYSEGPCKNMFTGCTNASTSTFHTDGDWSSWTTAFANINTWTYATYTPAP